MCAGMGQVFRHGICSGRAGRRLPRSPPARRQDDAAGIFPGVVAMRLPQFLLGMLVISGSVAAWAYLTTGSVWVALAWTAINATLLQVGYFVLLVRLIHLPLPGQPKQVAV